MNQVRRQWRMSWMRRAPEVLVVSPPGVLASQSGVGKSAFPTFRQAAAVRRRPVAGRGIGKPGAAVARYRVSRTD